MPTGHKCKCECGCQNICAPDQLLCRLCQDGYHLPRAGREDMTAAERASLKRQMKHGPRLGRKQLTQYLLEVCHARKDEEANAIYAGSRQ